MIPLSTPVNPLPLRSPLGHSDGILAFGSCFAENISARLDAYRFRICANPTGILYNPASIQRVLVRLLEGRKFTEDDLFMHNELWRSFTHHGSFAHPDKQEALAQINTAFETALNQIQSTRVLFLTFGSAFAWYLKEQPGVAVANCHKLPAETFERRMIPAHEIARQLGEVLQKLKARNPELQVIMTVSPVRHLRHYAPENSLSKAQLITASHLLTAELDFAHYFPAYEIMLDELRDYRFYADDLVHPNELAQRIIWERFCETCLSEKSRQFIADYTPVLQMQNHRPIHPETKSAAKFQQALEKKITALQKKYPDIGIL
ncbi:GSCFA domain-containing protein [Verrucomicrobiota bacterium]